MTAAPIPALAHDHYSPRGHDGTCFRSRPRRPPQPKRFFRRSVAWASSSIRPRRSPRTCPTTPADFRAPPNARPSNPHSPSPLAAAISAARGFLPRRLSDAGPSALASASVPGRRPKPLTTSGRSTSGPNITRQPLTAWRQKSRLNPVVRHNERLYHGAGDCLLNGRYFCAHSRGHQRSLFWSRGYWSAGIFRLLRGEAYCRAQQKRRKKLPREPALPRDHWARQGRDRSREQPAIQEAAGIGHPGRPCARRGALQHVLASRSNRGERMPWTPPKKLTRADPRATSPPRLALRAAVSVPLSRAQCRRNRGGSAGSNTWSAPDGGFGKRPRDPAESR